MAPNGLPEAVQRLIGEHIDSVEQLEVLLLLRRQKDRPWCADTVARELRIAAASASERLVDLAHRGMLAPSEPDESSPEGQECFRYSPANPRLDEAVSALAAAYSERRVSVINLIFSKPTDRIRTFADAFRVRRD